MGASLPDAPAGNWVDRFAPSRLRPWLRLARLDRPTGIWLLMLPGWQGVALAASMRGEWPSPRLLAVFAGGAVLMRAAGCAYNDIVDRDLDAQVARTARRPVASGEIPVRGAWALTVGLSLLALVLLLTLDRAAILLGFASLGLVAAYPFMKRITWWPQAWLGLTFNWGAPMGFAAALGPGPNYPDIAPAALLYASGICWTLGYDTIYALQDLEDDALAGVKSSARRLGPTAPGAIAGFYVASALLALACWRSAGLAPTFLPIAALFAGQLAWQAARVRTADPARALRLFRSNTIAGMLLTAAIVAGHWRSLGWPYPR